MPLASSFIEGDLDSKLLSGMDMFQSQAHLIVILLATVWLPSILASLYDPHLFPDTGPFFEGWYVRLTDPALDTSIGALFGHVLPEDLPEEPVSSDKLAYIGLLVSTKENNILRSYNAFPSVESITITVKNGSPVTANPDHESPADFMWQAPPYGNFIVKHDSAEVNFTIEDVYFHARLGPPVPWASDGNGPEGKWDRVFNFPVSWFVYSLASPVVSYTLVNRTSGQRIDGDSGVLHMEKNWGYSFPESWIWSEGVGSSSETKDQETMLLSNHADIDTSENISYALSYGPVSVVGIPIKGHLFGYRNKKAGISEDFRPDNSVASTNIEPCKGMMSMTFTGLLTKVELNVTSDVNTFSECLYGPMPDGFRQVCKESYTAVAHIVVSKRGILGWKVVDKQTLRQAALEFGAGYTCNKECQGTK